MSTPDEARARGRLSFGGALADRARRTPDAAALVWVPAGGAHEHRTLTWAELDRRATQVARLLQGRGTGRETVVAIALGNTPEHVVTAFAVWRLGGTVLPLSPTARPAERDAILEAGAARLVVADWDGGHEAVTAADVAGSRGLPADPLPDVISPRGWAIATGGSTGRPRVVTSAEPHEHTLFDTAALRLLGRRGGMRQLTAGPIHHSGHFGSTYRGLLMARLLVLLEAFDAATAARAIERYRIETATLTPTMMRWIAALPGIDGVDLSSLTSLVHTGGPCAPDVKRWWIDRVGPRHVYEYYGSTEEIGAAAIDGEEWLAHPGSVGRPLDCEMRILGPKGEELPAREIGEIYARGSLHATRPSPAGVRRTPEGFASVGDLGWMDEDGYLYIADRRTDLILTGGANVYPAEVEAVLCRHPAVRDAAVIGIDDKTLGKRVHAVLQLDPAAAVPSDRELYQFCGQHLSTYKVPVTYEFVERLPRDEAGKLRRSALSPVGA